jgi:AbrB family looped-hinge helix DNA binding protein
MAIGTTVEEGFTMKEQLTIVTRKGQITVPAEIRRALNLQVGDKVAISLDENDSAHAHLRPVHSVADMTFGAIMPRRQPEDPDELRDQFMEAASERDARTKRRS